MTSVGQPPIPVGRASARALGCPCVDDCRRYAATPACFLPVGLPKLRMLIAEETHEHPFVRDFITTLYAARSFLSAALPSRRCRQGCRLRVRRATRRWRLQARLARQGLRQPVRPGSRVPRLPISPPRGARVAQSRPGSRPLRRPGGAPGLLAESVEYRPPQTGPSTPRHSYCHRSSRLNEKNISRFNLKTAA